MLFGLDLVPYEVVLWSGVHITEPPTPGCGGSPAADEVGAGGLGAWRRSCRAGSRGARALPVAQAAQELGVDATALYPPIRRLQAASALAKLGRELHVDRGWPHHVLIRGSPSALPERSFAMTEQPRTISRERIGAGAGMVSQATLTEVEQWLRDFTGL